MTTAPDGPRAVADSPRSVLLVLAVAVVVLVPAIVAAVAITRPQWYPTGDMAQAELHVRGFWSHPPLVGAAGRIQSDAGVQGSHPGPGLWLAMWPLYALLGSTSTALVVSIVTVHVVTAALALWLALRQGGPALAIALAALLAVIVRAGGPDVFTEPWNPWMGLLPFLVFLLACWSALDGTRWALVLAVVAGSYSVQAHTGYILIVAGLLAFVVGALVVRWFRARRNGERDADAGGAGFWWWTAGAAVAGLVVWIPPLLDQLYREPGNISILRESFGHPDAPYLGLGEVAEVTVTQFNLLGPWLVGPDDDGVGILTVAGFVAFLALWAAGVVAARRRHAVGELRLHLVLGVAAVLAVASVSRIFGLYLEYTVRWIWFITVMVVAASVVSLWRSWPRNGRASRVAVAVCGAVVVVMVLVGSVQFADRAGPTGDIDSAIVRGLVPRVEGALDPDTPYLVRWWDPTVLGATGIGLVLELERRGFHTGVDQQFAAAALPSRVLPEDRAGAVLYVVVGTPAIERARALPGVVEVGEFDVRSPEQAQRSDELRAELTTALTESGHGDLVGLIDAQYGLAQLLFADPPLPDDVVALLDEYVALRQPTALFEAAPFTPVLPLG